MKTIIFCAYAMLVGFVISSAIAAIAIGLILVSTSVPIIGG